MITIIFQNNMQNGLILASEELAVCIFNAYSQIMIITQSPVVLTSSN
jgi:hypothetical protein